MAPGGCSSRHGGKAAEEDGKEVLDVLSPELILPSVDSEATEGLCQGVLHSE